MVLGEPEQSVSDWILRMLGREALFKISHEGKLNDLERVGDTELSLKRWNGK